MKRNTPMTALGCTYRNPVIQCGISRVALHMDANKTGGEFPTPYAIGVRLVRPTSLLGMLGSTLSQVSLTK